MTSMQRVFCLAQRATDVPSDYSWLTLRERAVVNGFMFEKRRKDWVLGRWTAKLAMLRYLGLKESDIGRLEVLVAADGAPHAALDGNPRNLVISISHSKQRAFCAVADDDVALGCDIEHVEPRDAAFSETFLTTRERHWADTVADSNKSLVVTLIWSAKESVLKATHEGLTADTWTVDVDESGSLREAGWHPLHARHIAGNREFCGWWRCDDDFVFTLAADTAVQTPIALRHGKATR